MLKNAKKVQLNFVEPIKEELLEEGVIPSAYMDEYLTSVEDKALAFPRKFEADFLRAYGQTYHDYRKASWKKAKLTHTSDTAKLPRPVLRANAHNWSFDPQLLSIGPALGSETRKEFHFRVKLPNPYYRDVNLTLGEEMRAVSGLISSVPDPFRNQELFYQREYETHFATVGLSELDELKHIYKTYWYAGMCSHYFLQALYEVQGDEYRVEGFTTQRRNCHDGLQRSDDTVIFSLNGKVIYISVDQLYTFITASRRFERRDYAYGEAYSDSWIIFAVWLLANGVSEAAIIEGLTPALIDEALESIEAIHRKYYPPRHMPVGSEMGSDESLPSWILRAQQELRELSISENLSTWEPRDIVKIENRFTLEVLPSFEDAIAHLVEDIPDDSTGTPSLILKRSEHSFLSHISNSEVATDYQGEESDDNSEIYDTFSENSHDAMFEYGFAPYEDFEQVLHNERTSYFYAEGDDRVLTSVEKARLRTLRPNHWARDSGASYAKYVSVRFGLGTFDPRLPTRVGWHALRVRKPP